MRVPTEDPPLPRPSLALALALTLVALPAPHAATLAAQAPTYLTPDGKEPPRPKLPADADANDPRAYIAYGHARETPWKKSFDAYYWAYRLDPTNEIARLFMSNAVLYSQSPEWRYEYLYERAEYTRKSKQAALMDTLETLAYLKDPLAHATSSQCRADAEVMRVTNPLVQGDYFYNQGCWGAAAEKYADVVGKRPEWLDVRYRRARALYFNGQPEQAIVEVQAVIDSLSARDQKRTSIYYVSKEVLEVMRGDMLVNAQDFFNAKKAYARALEENLAYAPAHVRLARVALLQGELEEALQEYAQALDIDERDAVTHSDYGVALLKAQRWAEAEAQFKRAIELEPYWAVPRFNLALAIDNQGRREDAIAAYKEYVVRAPKSQGRNLNVANARLVALTTVAEKK